MKQITVIVRCHSNEQYLENALLTIINQTLDRNYYDILVIEDNATEGVKLILNSYKKYFKILHTDGIGANNAAVVGFKKTKTKYVILMDSDDFFMPYILEDMYNSLETDKSDFVYGDYIDYYQESGYIRYISSKNNIYNQGSQGNMFRVDLLRKLGYYDKSLLYPEYKLLKQIKDNYKCSYIEKPMLIYRRHPMSITADKDNLKLGMEQLKEIMKEDFIKIREY